MQMVFCCCNLGLGIFVFSDIDCYVYNVCFVIWVVVEQVVMDLQVDGCNRGEDFQVYFCFFGGGVYGCVQLVMIGVIEQVQEILVGVFNCGFQVEDVGE